MSDAIWIVMPIAGAEEYTEAAISDCLGQSVPTRLLLVNQGVETDFRRRLERIAEAHEERVFLWNHDPPLPSLAGTWNRALRFVWATGGTEALVVNNDIRMRRGTVEILQAILVNSGALFVSAVGVTAEDYEKNEMTRDLFERQSADKGGPDFSCFLISKEAHDKYPFDEHFIPAYCEDLDTHRRYMLGGDGTKIFSVNLPYLHYASGTLKSMDPAARAARERAIDGSRAYYANKWGGPVNQERFILPFDETTAQDGVTTPELQRRIQHVDVSPATAPA